MTMHEHEQPGAKKEQYVTELAGPDDRWLSITDASRTARRQEHTIRSWVRDGVLPVHPDRVGINKKTRRVRLSDLAKLTPILDIDAAIATEVGSLDLVSIPRQQQKIKEEHDRLQADHAHLRQQLVAQEHEHQSQIALLRAAFDEHLVGQQQRHAEAAAEMTQLRALLADMNARFGGALDSIHRLFDEQTHVHIGMRAEFLDHLMRDRQATAEHIQAVQAQAEGTLRALFSDLQRDVEARFTLEAHGRDDAIHALTAEVTGDLADMTSRIAGQEQAIQHGLKQLATALEVATSAAHDAQKRLDTQTEEVQELRRQLLEERQARETLVRQVAALSQSPPPGEPS
ncbi:MAG: hypothetical protein ABI456_15895 [Ktedonobacteraceae bacterium]